MADTLAAIILIIAVMVCHLPAGILGQCDNTKLANITQFEDTVYLFEGQAVNVTISVDQVSVDGALTFASSDDSYFTVEPKETFVLRPDVDDFPVNITATIHGRLISISDLVVQFEAKASGSVTTVSTQTVGVKRVPSIIQVIYIYVLMAWILVSYLSMGGSMDIKAIWANVRRPYGVLIGIFSQFIIMPAMTFVIAKLAAGSTDPTIALGIILVGTCPGGWLSNIFSVLLDVDFVLSVTMTFFSSVIAMGMMPLNLLIYATPYTKDNARLETPFKDLIVQLILLVVPCFIGIALRAKFPKFGYYSEKVMKPISAMLIVIGLSLAIASDFYAFISSPPAVWIVSFVTPMFGAFFGLALSRIFARSLRVSITIALETGIQNALLGRTIVGLFYPQPEADLITRVLLITVVFTMVEGVGASLLYSLFRYVLCKERCRRMFEDEDDDGDEDDVKVVVRSEPDANDVYVISGRGSNGRYHAHGGIDNHAMDISTGRV